MKRVYLCSRIAKDAHDVNNYVANYLRERGFLVFVPHEAHWNEQQSNAGLHAPDREIYEQDMSEMRRSDACVVVGRIGTDCGFEVGWFERNGTPTVWLMPGDFWAPMLDRVFKADTLEAVGNFLKSHFPLFPHPSEGDPK